MLKLSHAALVFISGLVWLAVGCFLLPLGLKLLLKSAAVAALETGSYPLLNTLTPYLGGTQQVALLLIVLGLMIGYVKSNKILSKSVHRSVERIKSFSNPTSLGNLYSRGYYILFASMVLLGMSIRFLGVADDIRGLIDVAVGAALINGAILYFREALALRKAPLKP